MKKNFKNILLYLGIPIIFIMTIISVSYLTKTTEETKYSQIVALVTENEVSEFSLNLYSGELKYKLRADGKVYKYSVADPSIFYNDIH